MAILGAAALMFFGPEQLPKVARKVGLLVRDVQNTSQSFIREMERAGDDGPYNPDISRAHLIEEASGVAPIPNEYVPPPQHESYDPYAGEPYDISAFSEHSDHAVHVEQSESADAVAELPASTPVIHDIVPPQPAHAAADHDLPP